MPLSHTHTYTTHTTAETLRVQLHCCASQAPDDAQGPGQHGDAAAPAEPGLCDLVCMLEILGGLPDIVGFKLELKCVPVRVVGYGR